MNKKIIMALRELGVPANLDGYEYLKDSISLCLKDPSYLKALTKRLYPLVAHFHETTEPRVERAIRHAVEIAWDRGNPETMERYFGWTVNRSQSRPSNGEFIATVAEQLRMEADGK